MLIRSRKLSPRGVSVSRETHAGEGGGGVSVGQMKLLSAGIIIGRYHQIYRKKSAEALSWTRLEIYRVRNYHETGVSATFGIAYIVLGEHVTGHIEFE